MSLDKKVSDLLSAQIPDYVQEFYPLFVVFVTKYFEWLEQPGNPQEIIQNIQLNADIDTTASSLATKFMSIYAPSFPQVSALDRTILVKNFREFYRSKGSEESFRYFFRAFFNDEIVVKLPGDQLFDTSAGDWYVEKKLRVQAVTGNPLNLATVQIVGNNSNATAVVEEAVKSYGGWDLRLENRSLAGTFNSSETITGIYYDHVANTSSEIIVLNTQPLQTLPGRQRGGASLLSSDRVLQDSIYWQQFSYVIRTRINLDRWEDAILEQLHPTGRNIFGEILLDNSTSMAVSSTTQFSKSTAIESEVRLFTSSTSFYLQPGYTWDRLANFRTGTSATTTAGIVVYQADYTYGGENVTFAQQGAIDGATVYAETFTYSSITGTISVPTTTGQTATYRDLVRYSAPVTSITGTVNAATQAGSSTMTFTGTGTLYRNDVRPSTSQIWWRTTGRDTAQNLIYEYYPAVLTIRQLPITGTLTIAAQTPVAPDYLLTIGGTNTRFRSDLLITGLNTSSGIRNETTSPIIEEGQPEPLLFLDNWPMSGDITFDKGTTAVTGVNTFFLSEADTLTTSTLTVIKPLLNRYIQVSSIPTTTEFYQALTSQTLSTTLSGITLSFALTTSNYSAIATTTYGFDRSTRYDIPTPFPIYFLNTSTTKLYVHASGFIAAGSSMPSFYNTGADFRPFEQTPFVGVLPNRNNNLASVYHGSQGVTPNRYYTVYYNGDYGRANRGGNAYALGFPSAQLTSHVVHGATTANPYAVVAGLTATTTPTSGTATNGYYRFTLPWSIFYGNTSITQIFVGHNGVVGLGGWIDPNGIPLTQDRTLGFDLAINAIVFGDISTYDDFQLPLIPRQVNRMYSGTLGSAPNRSHIIRFEGDWHTSTTRTAGTSRLIYQLEFKENNLTSITVSHGHPAQVNFTGYSGLSFFELRCLRTIENQAADGFNYTAQSFYNDRAFYYDFSTHVGGVAGDSWPNYYVPSTSGLISFYGSVNEIYPSDTETVDEPRTPQKWEISFPENSASPILLRTGQVTRQGGDPAGQYTEYKRAINDFSFPTLTYTQYEWSERYGSGVTTRDLITSTFSNKADLLQDSSTTRAVFSKFPSSLGVTAGIPSTSILILRTWNNFTGDFANPTEVNNQYYKLFTVSDVGTPLVTWNQDFLYRWPQDGFNATGANTNPNPALFNTIQSFTYCYDRTPIYTYQSGGGGGKGGKGGKGGGGSYVITGYNYSYRDDYGIVFSYGSSAATHSRFIQTVPSHGYGPFTISISGYVGNNNVATSSLSYNSLAGTSTSGGDELELWYSTTPSIQPPTAGQSPSVLGWSRFATIAGSGNKASTGGYFDVTNTLPAGFFGNTSVTLTWLIWQKSFVGTGASPSARTSEYAISEIYLNTVPQVWGIGATNRDQTLRNILSSGSVVRIPNRTTKLGATTLEDYYVAEDPVRRRIDGDNYLILRPVGSVTSIPRLSSINSWSTSGGTGVGTYNIALNNIPVSIVETRTINNIANNTSLTVSTAWSSTSNRVWGGGSGIGYTRRSFAINTVLSNTLMTVRAPATAPTRYNAPITTPISITSVADRRFAVVSIANNTTITVSGGGIYSSMRGNLATFAAPKPVTIDGQTGYVLSGYADSIVNTSLNTQWATDGLPGTDNQGVPYGTNFDDLTVTIYGYTGDTNPDGTAELLAVGSSFTVLRVINDSSILITGNVITNNFLNLAMISTFPAATSNLIVSGTGTLFAASTVTVSGATQVFQEVTEFDFNDRRTGFLQVQGQLLRVIDVIDNTTLIASSNAIRAPIVNSAAESFRRVIGFAPPRALGRPGGPTFDKAGASIFNEQTLVVQDPNVNYTLIQELYHSSSNLNLVSGTTIINTSVSITAGSSVLLLVTWTKDLADSATNEDVNKLQITVSSSGTFIAKFNDEIQRNHKDIALGRTQLYKETVYLNSSNSITSTNIVAHGDTTSTAVWNWIPYNVKRAGTYSRFTLLIDSSTVSTISIVVGTGPSGNWEALAGDFLNISVIGTA